MNFTLAVWVVHCNISKENKTESWSVRGKLSVTSIWDTISGWFVSNKSRMLEPLVGVCTHCSKERSCTREPKIAAFLSQPIGDRDS